LKRLQYVVYSLILFSLAVIFIIRIFSTSTFRVPKLGEEVEMARAANSPVFKQSAKGFETVR